MSKFRFDGDGNRFRIYDATGRDFGTDVALSDMVNAYTVQGAIGQYLLPTLVVPRQFGFIPGVTSRPRAEQLARAPGVAPSRVMFDIGSVGYMCQGRGVMAELPFEDIANADIQQRLEASAAKYLVTIMQVGHESSVASLFADTTKTSTSFTVASAWGGTGNALANVRTMLDTCEDNGGYRPSVVGFGRLAWRQFSVNSSVVAGLQGYVTPARAGDLLRVREVHVAEAIRDASGEGLPYAPTPLWDDVIVGVYQPPNPGDLFAPRFGAVASWLPNDARASISGQYAAYKFDPDQKSKSRGVEVEDYACPLVIDKALGVRLVGCNSSQ